MLFQAGIDIAPGIDARHQYTGKATKKGISAGLSQAIDKGAHVIVPGQGGTFK